MASPVDLHNAVLSRLRALGTITVYDGTVPSAPPANRDGKVYPYAVLWVSAGLRPPESRTLDSSPSDDLRWRAPVTVAAGEVDWLLKAVQAVRTTLDGWVPLPFSSPLEEDGSTPQLLEDRDVSPVRMFLPMSFVTTTG